MDMKTTSYNHISKMKEKHVLGVILVAVFLSLSGCYYDVDELLYGEQMDCNLEEISFALDIEPVLSSRCRSCHDAPSPSGSILLENYDDVLVQVDNGLLLCTIQHQNDCSPMPKNSAALDACTIDKIVAWVDAGAPNN